MKTLLILAITLAVAYGQSDDSKELSPKGCGYRLPELEQSGSKIVGGVEATPGDWNWQISMNYNGRHKCGGSLINSQWVVTASHCVDGYLNPAPYSINLGNHNRVTLESWAVTRKVAKIIMHEQYKSTNYDYDIALIKLDRPVIYSKYIAPVCFPKTARNYVGQTAIVTGWGATRRNGAAAPALMQVDLPILTDQKCKDNLRIMNPRLNTDIEICAGDRSGGKDSCQGDSGGPLVLRHQDSTDPERGQWNLIGIVAYGSLSCTDGGVYTRTGAFYDWVLDKIQKN